MTDIRLTTVATARNPIVGDLYLDEDGQFEIISGIDYIAQSLSIRLKFFQGEWYLDVRQGIPYFQSLFSVGASDTVIRSIFRQAILSAPGVVAIRSFSAEIDRRNRCLSVSFVADTTEGEPVEFSELLIEV